MSSRRKKKKKKSLISPFQIILIVIILTAFYFYKNPSQLNSLPLHYLPFDTSKLNLSEAKPTTPSASFQDTAGSLYSKATGYFLQFANNTNLPTKFDDIPEEVVVDQVVHSLTEEVKTLPQKQVKNIKTQFCQDVISEAVATTSAH